MKIIQNNLEVKNETHFIVHAQFLYVYFLIGVSKFFMALYLEKVGLVLIRLCTGHTYLSASPILRQNVSSRELKCELTDIFCAVYDKQYTPVDVGGTNQKKKKQNT